MPNWVKGNQPHIKAALWSIVTLAAVSFLTSSLLIGGGVALVVLIVWELVERRSHKQSPEPEPARITFFRDDPAPKPDDHHVLRLGATVFNAGADGEFRARIIGPIYGAEMLYPENYDFDPAWQGTIGNVCPIGAGLRHQIYFGTFDYPRSQFQFWQPAVADPIDYTVGPEFSPLCDLEFDLDVREVGDGRAHREHVAIRFDREQSNYPTIELSTIPFPHRRRPRHLPGPPARAYEALWGRHEEAPEERPPDPSRD